ncbi:hypothetical protein, partial [Klebsiella variicola]|uniref:hypothetical protein n=1 Tax=Klebsiella variicola TaxID=244366 RepID=UPI002B061CB7
YIALQTVIYIGFINLPTKLSTACYFLFSRDTRPVLSAGRLTAAADNSRLMPQSVACYPQESL